MSAEVEREPSRPEPGTKTASDFYFPAGGGTDPDFSPRADPEVPPGRFSRWLHSHTPAHRPEPIGLVSSFGAFGFPDGTPGGWGGVDATA